ncbi:hypothetical protein [Pseudomonas vranovensis]
MRWIVDAIATYGLDLESSDEIKTAALRWAVERGARSGRIVA